jgi:prolyl 4-hydroxylase
VAAAEGDDLADALLGRLQEELAALEFRQVDRMISTSDYDFPPNPWRLFTAVGNPVETGEDLIDLGRGAIVYLYTGGAFIWPGVRLGHKTQVPIPVTDGSPGGHKIVEMTTVSLRPNVFVLSDFLTEAECGFIKRYASSRMQPSGLAMMDSSGDSRDVRTSTQTFMERNGSPQIRALEERAHNLTRLPYDLGENIQVVRYEKGQKYGAHRDFFNPNDYHKQPGMLNSVEYGARNRLATVFWYLETVAEGHGGETFFPRALNEQGQEYHPWNGDHEDCYRGVYVQPVKGNAVLFYSMVPDGRLDERSLHGGCRPRGDGTIEKWGANQWIWNHPKRHRGPFPRKGVKQPARVKGKPGCLDSDSNCEAWAESGECEKNPEYMATACRASCGTC